MQTDKFSVRQPKLNNVVMNVVCLMFKKYPNLKYEEK